MRRTDGSKHSLRRLIGFAVGIALVLTVFSATGQSNGSVRVTASSIRYAATTPTGVRTSALLEGTYTGTKNGVKQFNVPVHLPSGTLGNLAKSAIKRGGAAYGWYSLAKGLIDGAGWAIDELQKQVYNPAKGTYSPPGSKMYCAAPGGGSLRCTTSLSGAISIASVQYTGCDSAKFDVGGISVSCRNGNDRMFLAQRTVTANTFNHGSGSQFDEPVPDQQLGELLKRSPQVVNAILIDPESGAPIRTAELVNAMNELRKSLEQANGLEPAPDVQPTDDPTKPERMESTWPGFCNWASVVCEFIDWVKSDGEPHKELPETELQIDPQGWNSGIGGGTCPAPQTFSITVVGAQGQAQFDWQPACDFASTLKPFLITVCSLVAVFILAGLRNGAKS
ncbi:virulence factor TspB C-terminal domain-related protein [Stenotrophomonas sp. TWI587]|uniref:virulence factor TspB C-terminal domain-related protein n=1 Tax=Stenotrophomonas sp. TWI587 TaxID=3136783 RepID=UPI003208A24A